MNTDPIADLLTRIRNAQKAHKTSVAAPHSKIKENMLEIMKKWSFIEDYKVVQEKTGHKTIEIKLKTDREKLTLKRISKAGQRIYIKKEDLKVVKSGLGISIISTSKGLMTNLDANKNNIGGEHICEIY